MAYSKFSGVDHYTGLSTDTKPTSIVKQGSTFIEEDTHHLYQYGADGWFLKAQTINSEKTEGSRTSSHVSDDTVAALLIEVLEELKKMNIHLGLVTDEIVTNQEIE